MSMRHFLLGCSLLFFLAACTKDKESFIEGDPLPEIGEAPVIELLEVTPTTVVEYQDSIAFTISYLDGDGDLGTDDPDKTSISLVDNRDADLLVFDYHLSPRTPSGSELAIQGELTIVLANTILLDNSNDEETTTFTLTLTDRAGNMSNAVTTETITIKAEE